MTQPMLLRINDRYFVKADKTAIAVPPCCFVEAVELLFMSFFVFGVEYPSELRIFYGFFERLLDVKSSIKSSTLTDLMRALHQMVNSRVPDN